MMANHLWAMSLLLVLGGSLEAGGLRLQADAPDQAARQQVWISGALGAGTFGSAASVGLHLGDAKGCFSLKWRRHREIQPLLSFTRENEYQEIGIMQGVAKSLTWGRITFSTGISYIHGTVRGQDLGDAHGVFPGEPSQEMKTRSALGLPLEITLAFAPLRAGSIGITAFANGNREQVLSGLQVELAFGNQHF